MKRIFILLIALFSLTILHASGEESNTLIVAIDHNGNPPWGIVKGEKISGIDIEIINRIASKMGIAVSFRPFPFARCIRNMENGSVDLMAYLSFKDERRSFLRYVEPAYMNGVKSFFVMKDSGKKIQKYEDLFGLTVGTVRGSKHFQQFDIDERITHFEGNSTDQLLNMLMLKRLDAVIDNDTVGLYHINQLGLRDKIEMADYKVVLKNNGYFAFSKKSKHLDKADAFEKILREMLKNGEIDSIIRHSLIQ